MGMRCGFNQVDKLLFQVLADLWLERSDCTHQFCCLRDDVVGGARVEASDADYTAFHRIQCTRHQRLSAYHDLSTDHHWIN